MPIDYSSNHMPASAFMGFTGVSYATEDDIIMPPDDTMSSVAHQVREGKVNY